MEFREAAKEDLKAIIDLYADDALGTTREAPGEPIDSSYIKAFEHISDDPNNRVYVLAKGAEIVATIQYTVIPHLCRKGVKRAQLEAIRVHKNYRGQGIGEKLVQFTIDIAKKDGCSLVQLTTDKTRVDAHRFYENLGFTGSHLGMKLNLV